jgi:hypothetical protein
LARLRISLRLRHCRYLISLLALLALLLTSREPQQAVRAAGSYSFGAENSWIRVQNIGNANANVEVDYFDELGRIAGRDVCPSPTCPPMFPGSGWTFFQRDNPSLPPGFQGSAIVSTDQPIVAIMAKDVTRGSTFAIAGDTVTTGAGSHRIYLPITAKRDGPQQDWNGRFAIQNMSDTVTACVTITYLSNYTDGEVAWEPYRLGANGVARLPGCPNGGMPLPPRGTIFRDPDTMPVSNNFTGSVRIDLSKNGSNQGPEKQFISATADTWNSIYASFGSYRGLDESELGTDIILPLIDRQVGPSNSYSTHFQIVNKDPSKPAHVSLRFDGFDLNNGNQFVSKTNTITVRGARLCFQDRDDYANCLADGDKLPVNFVGTVRLTSDQPVGVIVNRSTTLNDTFTDYRGIRPQDAANRVLLPDLNKNYGPVPGVAAGWNSWFRVMVADGGHANVTVNYYGLDLPGGHVSYTVPVDREFTVFQYLEPMLPDGFAGTAILESDRPIVALANLTTDVFKGDPDFLYNGIALNQ